MRGYSLRQNLLQLVVGAACTVFYGCEETKGSDGVEPVGGNERGPVLRLVDRVYLEETDSLFLGRPLGMTLDDDGAFYVTDGFANRVTKFRADGRLMRTFGRAGRGPGEFGSIGTVVFVLDSVLVVQDFRPREFSVFRLDDGRYIGSRSYTSVATSSAVTDSAIWLGGVDVGSGFGIARWDIEGGLERTLSGPDSEEHQSRALAATLVPLPSEYSASEFIRGVFGIVQVLHWADTLMVGFGAEPYLVTHHDTGVPLDTLRIPRTARRGVPHDLAERLQPGRVSSYEEVVSAASVPFLLARRRDGRLLVVHFDTNADGRVLVSRVYVSLLSADRRSACVDRELEVSDIVQPLVAARADTLIVLEQEVPGADTLAAKARVSKYLVEAASCEWLEIE